MVRRGQKGDSRMLTWRRDDRVAREKVSRRKEERRKMRWEIGRKKGYGNSFLQVR